MQTKVYQESLVSAKVIGTIHPQSAEGAAGQWPQEFWFSSKFKL
jgi:hypothetical protein